MIDVITYTANLPAFRQWLADNHLVWHRYIGKDENGVYVLLDKTPTFSNGNHYVSLVRVDNLDFINASPLEILSQVPMGQDAFVFDAEAQLKYNAAYPRPIIEVPASNFMGVERPAYTYQAPERFGGFA